MKQENRNEINNNVFSNFWQPQGCEDVFFNVDICEEVTNRIKSDANYIKCVKRNNQLYIGKKANISVSVDDGLPYILRSADGPGKSECEIDGNIYITPLFTKEELATLLKIARNVRRKNNIEIQLSKLKKMS